MFSLFAMMPILEGLCLQIPWVEKVGKTDPQYWDWDTHRAQRTEPVFRSNLAITQHRYNQSGGFHTLQEMFGCVLGKDGSKGGYDKYAYDGRNYLSFHLETLTWMAANGPAQITKREWDADSAFKQYKKSYLEEICIEWLRRYLDFGKETLLRTVDLRAIVGAIVGAILVAYVAIIKATMGNERANVGAIMGAIVGDIMGAIVGAIVGNMVRAIVEAIVGPIVGIVIRSFLGAIMGATVAAIVEATVADIVGAIMGIIMGAIFGAIVGIAMVAIMGPIGGAVAAVALAVIVIVYVFKKCRRRRKHSEAASTYYKSSTTSLTADERPSPSPIHSFREIEEEDTAPPHQETYERPRFRPYNYFPFREGREEEGDEAPPNLDAEAEERLFHLVLLQCQGRGISHSSTLPRPRSLPSISSAAALTMEKEERGRHGSTMPRPRSRRKAFPPSE